MAIRPSVEGMTAEQLAALRDAWARSQALADDRGYGYWAGVHGLPLPIACKHSPRTQLDFLFLPWHRAYLYFFERSLQDRNKAAAVPWWDWTSDGSHAIGVPTAFAEKKVGKARNPLYDARVAISPDDVARVRAAAPGTMTPGTPPRTRRDPDVPDELPRKATIDSVLAAPTFEDFSTRLENVHNSVHGWVGGTMTLVPVAAYDPIFWAHHAAIDRVWYLWQMSPFGVDPPAAMMDTVLDPFPMTVRQTLNINNLGYDYAVEVIH